MIRMINILGILFFFFCSLISFSSAAEIRLIDQNGDMRIGIKDAIFHLQTLSELRTGDTSLEKVIATLQIAADIIPINIIYDLDGDGYSYNEGDWSDSDYDVKPFGLITNFVYTANSIPSQENIMIPIAIPDNYISSIHEKGLNFYFNPTVTVNLTVVNGVEIRNDLPVFLGFPPGYYLIVWVNAFNPGTANIGGIIMADHPTIAGSKLQVTASEVPAIEIIVN